MLEKKINSLLAQTHNSICFGFFLHKNNTSSLLLGLYHASVNRISIVLMQITPQNRLHYGIVQGENRGYYTVARRYEFYFRVAKQYFTNERSE